MNAEMLAAIKLILAANPNCALTGSNSLLLQGKKIRRDAKDIDIYCPDGKFQIIPGMTMPELDEKCKDAEYENDGLSGSRTQYIYKGVKVDVFVHDAAEKYPTKKVDGIKVCYPTQIINAKVSYFEAGGGTKGKHKLDVVFYLLMN